MSTYRSRGALGLLGGSCLNCMSHLYDRIQKMRVVPFDTRSFAELLASAMGPMVPLLPYFVDVPEPLLRALEEGRKLLH